MDATFSQLSEQYDAFIKIAPQIAKGNKLIKAQNILNQIIRSGRYIYDPEERQGLSLLARNLGEIIFNLSEEYPLVRLDQYVDQSQVNFFVNRESEIGGILSSLSPAYYLIDAPLGYGKTALLRELKQRFKKEGWSAGYVSISKGKTLADVAVLLAHEFSLDFIATQESEIPVEYLLASVLASHWSDSAEKRKAKEGLVLLIDFRENPSAVLVEQLVKNLIPAIQESLRTWPYFAQKQNRFRTLIAGRDLAALLEIENQRRRQYKVLRLTPFNYQNSLELTRGYSIGQGEKVLAQLAAHLFHLTGGHLGCMIQTLEFYKEKRMLPDRFIQFFSKTIWRDVVRQVAMDIRDQIPQPAQEIVRELDSLSIFRYLDETVLESILKDTPLSAQKDVFDLADDLTTTGLFEREGRFLQNHITRPLLTILLRNEKPDEFAHLCGRARDICAERLQQPYVQRPELWVIEYLFHSLQKHANAIIKPEQRRAIRQAFLHQDLPQALQLFLNEQRIQPHHRRAEQKALAQAIEEDGEFRFMVNYYLRESEYNNAPSEKLKQQINEFFATPEKMGA